MPFENQIPGNLLSYKAYVRPTAHRLYGFTDHAKTKHQQNVRLLLHILFVSGSCTTWEMAKTSLRKVPAIRNQEKIFRRLLIGRIDRSRRSDGIVSSGLVVKEEQPAKKPYARYRLSLYGILYCLDATKPSNKDIDAMAAKYSSLFPKIFGRWASLKSVLGSDAYNLRILAKGIYLNNLMMARTDNPLYELMSFVHIKYKRNFESISESNLSDQISYWFYTFLLYKNPAKLKKILAKDKQLQDWYMDFFRQTKEYYAQRLRTMKNSDVFS